MPVTVEQRKRLRYDVCVRNRRTVSRDVIAVSAAITGTTAAMPRMPSMPSEKRPKKKPSWLDASSGTIEPAAPATRKKNSDRPDAAHEAAAQPERQEAPLELAGDEAVGGAGEMQHVDDFAVGRHRTTGREHHREHRRKDDERQHQKAREDDRSGHGVELLPPRRMGVEARAIDGCDIAREEASDRRRGCRSAPPRSAAECRWR